MVFNIMLGIKMAVDATFDSPMYTPTDKDYAIRHELQVAPYKGVINGKHEAAAQMGQDTDLRPQLISGPIAQYPRGHVQKDLWCLQCNMHCTTLAP